jgi:hypothetical protein
LSELYQNRHAQFKFKIANDGPANDDDKLAQLSTFCCLAREPEPKQPANVAGDNLFTESLKDLSLAPGSEATPVYDVGDRRLCYGNVLIDG